MAVWEKDLTIQREDVRSVPPEEYDAGYYELLSREYLLNDVWSMKRIQDVVTMARPQSGERILDAGCGWGTYSIEAFKRGAQVCGIDYSIDAIRTSRRLAETVLGRNDIDFRVASVTAIPYRNGSFDKIICADLAEHISRNEFQLLLLEAHRVLREGGLLCLSTPNPVTYDLLSRFSGKVARLLTGERKLNSWQRGLLRAGKLASDAVLFLVKNREIERLCRQFHAAWLYPVVDPQTFKRAQERYGYLHVDLKPPAYLMRALRQGGFQVQRIAFSRGSLALQSLPFPLGGLWGGVSTIVAKKIRTTRGLP